MLEKSTHLSSLSKTLGGFPYQRHKPEETDLYKIIDQNLPTLQSHLSNADISLPPFVHHELRSYLRCGLLKHGFLRVKCNVYKFEHLVAFSCKLRGFCRGRRAHPAVLVAWLKHQHILLITLYLRHQLDNGYSFFPGRCVYFLPVNPIHLADASPSSSVR
jgi:hypothetical protein